MEGNPIMILVFFSLYADQSLGMSTDWAGMAEKELQASLKQTQNTNVAKNIILFLGDGMSISTVTASRIIRGRQKGSLGEEHYLKFEEFPNTALIKTYCNDRTVPDSASTATAFMCGEKTNYHTLGVNDNAVLGDCSSQKGNELKSILDWFNDEGRSTGIVTTSRVTHATPGAGYAHVANRKWEGDTDMEGVTGDCKDIAYQLVKENQFIKVIFGGGRYYFLPNTTTDPKYGNNNIKIQRRDGLDLIQIWKDDKLKKNNKATYLWNRQQLLDMDPLQTDYALGLFNDGHMQMELDRDNSSTGEPSIAEMTEKAIKILRKNNKGFFLLVEGGRIDSAHHDNNAKRSLYDTLAFEDAVSKALELVDEKDTLVLVTADHGHSFLIAGYSKRGNSLFGYVNPVKSKYIAKDGVLWTTLMYGTGPGYQWGIRTNKTKEQLEHKDARQAAAAPRGSSASHDGQDVAVYARGPMAHLFNGVHEQHYINYVMTYAACVGRHKYKCSSKVRGSTNSGNRLENFISAKTVHLIVLILSYFIHTFV